MTRNDPPSALYDADFFSWTQRQAAALRAIPRDTSVDVEHVAEEIEDLGKRDLREVVSFLERLIEHLFKLDACPGSRDRAHRKREATLFQRSAVAAFTPGMRRFLVAHELWARGCKLASFVLEEAGGAHAAADRSPYTVEALLAQDFDLDAALATLAATRDVSSKTAPHQGGCS